MSGHYGDYFSPMMWPTSRYVTLADSTFLLGIPLLHNVLMFPQTLQDSAQNQLLLLFLVPVSLTFVVPWLRLHPSP